MKKKTLLIGSRGQLGADLMKISPDGFIPWTSDQVDLFDLKTLEEQLEATDCTAIVNASAYNKTELAEAEPLKAYTVNGHAVGVMARVAAKKGVPLFHVSSDYVFDGKKEVPYLENDLTAPLSVYGASKALGESLALAWSDRNIVLRTASLFGLTGSREKKGNFVDTIVKKGREEGPIKVIDDIWMSPTSTGDLAKLILTFLVQRPDGGLYHAVNGGEASWFTFAEEIGRHMGFQQRIEPVSKEAFPSKIRRPAYSVLSNAKLLSVTPVSHWKEALSNYLKEKYS